MGDREILCVLCPRCGRDNYDVYYAPTCGFLTYTCPCGFVIDLEAYTGTSAEDYATTEEGRAAVRLMREVK